LSVRRTPDFYAAIGGIWACLLVQIACAQNSADARAFTEQEVAVLRSLALESLEPLPPDASNRFDADPASIEFGHRLFFDAALGANDHVACSTCHDPARYFTDGRVRSQAIGTTRRHAPSLIGVAYSPWLYWDGRRDSLWAQALVPLEMAGEFGSSRVDVVRHVTSDLQYRTYLADQNQSLPDFSDRSRYPARASPMGDERARADWNAMAEPDREAVNSVFVRVGKAIAAYERQLLPGPARFDRYVAALLADPARAPPTALMSVEELRGLRLFIDPRNQCIRCHNGPMFTNHSFHNVGSGSAVDRDRGRIAAIEAVLADEFNCAGRFSDAPPAQCVELEFMKRDGEELEGGFKVPTLRNVAMTAPYFHDGSLATLDAVLARYRSPPIPGPIGHQELVRLDLSDADVAALIAFLETLTSPVDADARWLEPPRE
jgi:cytochrome c peroxidase